MQALGAIRSITKGQVLRYMLLPQIFPRLHAFYQAGFMNLAYIIALVYRAVNILPPNHPVLLRKNRDNIGIRVVLAAAASELKFSIRHIDQVIIYFTVLLGLILLVFQFFVMLCGLLVNPVMAMPTTYADFFYNSAPATDIAYRLLFTVFGVPEIFNPGGTVGLYHQAFYSLCQFYSIGLLVVAVVIICYYIFAVLAETAETGTPFGKRYNQVWAPIRLVVALGLLIPIGYGLNSAQWITLYAAKLGSDFATKGWILFNDRMSQAFLNDPAARVGTPQAPELMNLAGYMSTVLACKRAYETIYTGTNQKPIKAYLVKNTREAPIPPEMVSTLFPGARDFFKNGDILIRFGEFDPKAYGKFKGNVYPFCGDLVILGGDSIEPGSLIMQEFYYDLVWNIYTANEYHEIRRYAEAYIDQFITIAGATPPAPGSLAPADFKETLEMALNADVKKAIATAVVKQGGSDTWKKDDAAIRELGWGAAGVWYNKIAQINGSLVTAVDNVPEPRTMPAVMEYMKMKQLQQNTNLPEPFKPVLSNGQQMQFNSSTDEIVAKALAIIYEYWAKDVKQTNNTFIDVVNLIFGTQGLFNMCANADVHPLAQLSILGKGLVEASIRNLGGAIAFAGIGATQIPFIGAASEAASSILLSIATITISMGFMLFYVLPFMPFLYFFFAVGGWVKGTFEAMVGLPLWALAHLRIDGEGLPGEAAMGGYYLIFEIFIRPVLIIFGLLASVVIFGAMVKVLNEIYSLVVVNLSGHDGSFTSLCGKAGASPTGGAPSAMSYFRGPIDELFFTIIYAIIVYMIGMSCFKLIDLVPNNLLRYMGANINSYNDMAGDIAEGMMLKLSVGTSAVSQQVVGGVIGGATGAVSNTMKAAKQAAQQS